MWEHDDWRVAAEQTAPGPTPLPTPQRADLVGRPRRPTGVVHATGGAAVSPVLAFDLPTPPNPIGPVVDGVKGIIGGGAKAAGQAALDAILHWVADSLASACTTVMGGLFQFLNTSSTVSLTQGWWAGPRAQHIVAAVGQIAGVLMIAFLLAVVIQGTLAGEPAVMLRATIKEVPLAVFGTVALVSVTGLLLALTDAASSMVLGDAPDSLGRFFSGFGVSANVLTTGLLGVILFLLFLVGALLVWVELLIRSSLIYLLIASAPLFLAARVWPVTRNGFRRLCEIGLALIFSKFVIALALALGAAALGGGGPHDGSTATNTGLDVAGLVAGATLMLLAAFTPFVLLRVLPILETAVVAHGISHSPARAANTVAQTAFYAQNLSAAGRGSGPASAALPTGEASEAAAGSTAVGSSAVGSGAASGAAAGAVAVPVVVAAKTASTAKRVAGDTAAVATRTPGDADGAQADPQP